MGASAARLFHEMPITRFLGIRVAAKQSKVGYRVEMDASPEALNHGTYVHGGAIATLIDAAAGFGALTALGSCGPTTDVHVRFIAGARAGARLAAHAVVERSSATTIVVSVRVTDQDDRLLATGSVGFAPGPLDTI